MKNAAAGNASLTAKAGGFIDVIRPESTFITVTPTVKNFYDYDLSDAQISVTAKEKTGGKWQEITGWEPQLTAELQENGTIVVQANTDHGIRTDLQYFLNLTLTDSEGMRIGTYTSGDDGQITNAYLREGEDYTLAETKAPDGYFAPAETIPISMYFS